MQVKKLENHQVSTNIPHIGALDDLRGGRTYWAVTNRIASLVKCAW